MSATLEDRLEETILEHWREVCKPRPDEKKVKLLEATAKELRRALKKERHAA